MPDLNESGSITPTQYKEYAAAWSNLIRSGHADALTQAFQLPEARLNFLAFALDDIIKLVSTPRAHRIKARFLLVPDPAAPDQSRFSATLFATDADDHCISSYYVPLLPQAAAASAASAATDAAAATNESTKIAREVALDWLTAWVEAPDLLFSFFTIGQEPMHGYNFELSTFTDPLAAAQPYADKALFLNLGLSTSPAAPEDAKICNLVVYIDLLDSRRQGSVAGLPEGDVFYDHGSVCPPALFV